MRDWLKSLDEIDRDCVHQWEKLLGIKFASRSEYFSVDWLIEEMILEYDTKNELRAAYPDIDADVKRILERDNCIIAEFENGYFLVVEVDEVDNEYLFTVCDSEGYYQAFGYTEYRSIDMYYPMNEIDYILQYCEPRFVKGSYKIIEAGSLEEYLESRKE